MDLGRLVHPTRQCSPCTVYAVEMQRDLVLSRVDVDHGRRGGEERRVLGKISDAQRGTHDDEPSGRARLFSPSSQRFFRAAGRFGSARRMSTSVLMLRRAPRPP